MWAELRLYVIVVGIALALGTISSLICYLEGRSEGSVLCDARWQAAQAKENVKEEKSDVKRDRAKPVNADRADKLKWLRDNARQ